MNIPVTCSMTFQDYYDSFPKLDSSVTTSSSSSSFVHRHSSSNPVVLVKSIARRRIEECQEAHFWTHKKSSTHYFHALKKRKVYGIIIWIGTTTNFPLVKKQIEVLKSETHLDPDNVIVGWMATEEQYPCRIASTLCESKDSYNSLMPKTRMNVAATGWSCAQRRPLRAMSHVLLLYDPSFMLVVDDDTFVNMKLLERGGMIDKYFREDLLVNNVILGQLSGGRKVTRHGFFYGGAGYLMGKALIDTLNSFVLRGPVVASDGARDGRHMNELSLFNTIVPLAQRHCKQPCAALNPGSEVGGLGGSANVTVRIVELCENLMAQEHTCYHSDHSLSRCFIHGTNSWPVGLGCEGWNVGKDGKGARLGMCFGSHTCELDSRLTCHRWKPSKDNVTVPVNMELPSGAQASVEELPEGAQIKSPQYRKTRKLMDNDRLRISL
jgi:hypothetical protein